MNQQSVKRNLLASSDLNQKSSLDVLRPDKVKGVFLMVPNLIHLSVLLSVLLLSSEILNKILYPFKDHYYAERHEHYGHSIGNCDTRNHLQQRDKKEVEINRTQHLLYKVLWQKAKQRVLGGSYLVFRDAGVNWLDD